MTARSMNLYKLATRLGIVALGIVIASCAPDGAEQTSMMVGKPAADFSLATVDNQSVKLSDLRGKVVVLDFWATWCPPCRASLPNLDRLSSDVGLAARGLKVFAINAQEPAADVKSFLHANQLSLPVLLDPDGSAERAYGADSLPTTVLIGRDGSVQYAIQGYGGAETEAALKDAIDKALAQGER